MSFLGDNIKVHFAGSDYDQNCLDCLEIAEVNYRLFTVYPAIANKKLDDDFTDKSGCVLRQQEIFKHVILDSGLFTLMFGGGEGQQQTRKSLEFWQDKTFEFIRQNNFTGTLVEIDCQKLLGVEDAWYFRKRARDRIGNRLINVFHYEDGKDGLDRLIEWSDYIAISVPEIRIIHPSTFRQDCHRLACYIKNKKPEIDIHLLGCTDKQMLAQNKFCSTADSSSWTGIYRFGTLQGRSAYNLKQSVLDEAERKCIEYLGVEKWQSLSDKRRKCDIWSVIGAEVSKKVYEKYGGSQD